MACMEFEMGKVSHSSVLVDAKVKERGVGGSGGRTSSKCARVGGSGGRATSKCARVGGSGGRASSKCAWVGGSGGRASLKCAWEKRCHFSNFHFGNNHMIPRTPFIHFSSSSRAVKLRKEERK